MGWPDAKGKANTGKAGGTFLQAAIEGAVVSALGLGSVSQKKGKGWQDESKHEKGSGKYSRTKQCLWEGCLAAQKHHCTWGGGTNCHCCARPLANLPPLERMVEWAYLEKLKTSPTARKGNGKGDATKGKGKDKGKRHKAPAAAEPTAEELAELRKARLASLKTGVAPAAGAKKDLSPIAEAMAQHLVERRTSQSPKSSWTKSSSRAPRS